MKGLIIKDKLLKLYGFILIKHKKRSIAVGLLLIILLGTIGIGYYYGIGMSEKQKTNRINKIVANKDYTKARDVNDRYYKRTDKKEILLNNLMKSQIDICEGTNTGSLDEAANEFKKLSEYVNSVEIIKTEIVSSKYSETVEITVQNNGDKNISYVKIGLDFKDASGNIVQSDWTNDDSIIKPNAKQKLTKMISTDIKFSTVQAEVLDFN